MGMDRDTGDIRELESASDAKENEVVFQAGELIMIKGCMFKVMRMHPNPENTLVLRGVPLKAEESNMI